MNVIREESGHTLKQIKNRGVRGAEKMDLYKFRSHAQGAHPVNIAESPDADPDFRVITKSGEGLECSSEVLARTACDNAPTYRRYFTPSREPPSLDSLRALGDAMTENPRTTYSEGPIPAGYT